MTEIKLKYRCWICEQYFACADCAELMTKHQNQKGKQHEQETANKTPKRTRGKAKGA